MARLKSNLSFSTKLKRGRKEAGLTRRALASGIVAVPYLVLIESGIWKPKSQLKVKFANRLGLAPDEFEDEMVQRVVVSLNTAKEALTSGDVSIAEAHAKQVLESGKLSREFATSASLILLQVRAHQGLFTGLIDDLEKLFKENLGADPELLADIGNEIIRVCFRSGNLGVGARRGDEMVAEYGSIWPEADVVELLCQVASCHFHRGDTQRANEFVSRALILAEKCKSPQAMTQSHWQLSGLASSRGDLVLALKHAKEATRWSKVAGLNHVLPILNNNAALIMLDSPNPDLERIHDLAESAYLDLLTQNSPGHAAYACITLSEVALRQGDFAKALMIAKKGLTELPPQMPGPKTSLYVQEAKVLARMGNYEDAKLQLVRAVEHMSEMDASKELAVHWGDVARVFVEVGLGDRAIYAYEQALQVAGLSREEQESLSR